VGPYAALYFVCAASDAGDARQPSGPWRRRDGEQAGNQSACPSAPVTHEGSVAWGQRSPPRCSSALTAPGKHSLRAPTPPQRVPQLVEACPMDEGPARIAQHTAQHTAQQHGQNTPTRRPSGGEHQISLLPSHFFLPSSHSIPRSLSSPPPRRPPLALKTPLKRFSRLAAANSFTTTSSAALHCLSFASLPSAFLPRAARPVALGQQAPALRRILVAYTPCRHYAKSRKMPPKKQVVEEKIPLGRPGNNLKSGIVSSHQLMPVPSSSQANRSLSRSASPTSANPLCSRPSPSVTWATRLYDAPPLSLALHSGC